MANNLFISYDLLRSGQDYSGVERVIRSLGPAARVNLSLWYVNSSSSAEEAAKVVRRVLDSNDRLMVVNASNNSCSYYNNLPGADEVLQREWNK